MTDAPKQQTKICPCTNWVHHFGALPEPDCLCAWTTPGITANVSLMIDPKLLDDLAARLAGSVPGGLQILQEDLKKNLRASLQAGIAKIDLVTREEFDVQSAVLARTREKLERLETQLHELENTVGLRTVGEQASKQPPQSC